VDWLLYYDLAQQWVGHGGEAHERAAMSRAYYAMFCTARNELRDTIEDEYSPPECGSEHMYVWNLYKEDRHPRGARQIGVLGNRLRRYRNRADYDDVILNFSDLVEDAMDSATELREHLEGLRV
jgi:uncharacterized protein (UPF0332 family)